MLSGAGLRKTGTGWEFASEAALEDFVWANLEQLFGLTCLKRQYYINGQVCDILGLSENKQLVVLELKNTEDRYIVQQLTRYYDALCEEKPFSEEIDYKQPIGLVAIAPSFHRDNFTDRKYSHLVVEFLRYEILLETENLYLQLKDVDNSKVSQIEIPHQETDNNEDIPPPPKALQKLLNNCEPNQQEEILRIRRKILSFDRRMEEMATASSIKYGNGKSKTSKLCAEFCSDSKGAVLLFLWLPLKNLRSEKIGRAKICWNYESGRAFVEGYVTRGIRTKKPPCNQEIAKRIEIIDRKVSDAQILTYEEYNLIKIYLINNTYEFIDRLVDMALEKWLKRI